MTEEQRKAAVGHSGLKLSLLEVPVAHSAASMVMEEWAYCEAGDRCVWWD